MSKEIPQLLKGFRDYLPQEQMARKKVISKISEVFERFGFAPLDTPTLEYYELLGGKYGEEGEQLMYKFTDNGDRQVAMRYDLTVPLARVVASYPELPKPFKRYQIAPVWRADKPQKGRYREFVQCDIDIVGSNSELADAEVIAAMYSAYSNLEAGTFLVKFNDRKLVDTALNKIGVSQEKSADFMRILDKMDKIGADGVTAALVEVGFSKDVLERYSQVMDEISGEYQTKMKEILSGLGVGQMTFDKFLMRGLAYYTGIVFEFILKEKPEFGSVGGGGRYDGLIEKTTGISTPAVGGSIGLDRLLAALNDMGVISPQTAAEVMVFNLDESLIAEYLNLVTNLRTAGLDAEIYYDGAKLDKQFKYAEIKNIQVGVIMGVDEAKNRKVNVKNLKTKEQQTVDLDDLVSTVKSMLW